MWVFFLCGERSPTAKEVPLGRKNLWREIISVKFLTDLPFCFDFDNHRMKRREVVLREKENRGEGRGGDEKGRERQGKEEDIKRREEKRREE